MNEIKTSKDGIGHLHTMLANRPKTVTRASFWRIPHTNPENNEVCLKLARYTKPNGFMAEVLDTLTPKSELTLKEEEVKNLITFLQENYAPFKDGAKKYIPVDESFDSRKIEHLKAIFTNPEKEKVLEFLLHNDIIPDDILLAVEHRKKVEAVHEFERMLGLDLKEAEWQKWFTENSWVLGTDFVEILDERTIDAGHISDFLMKAYDGFVDIVEIKRPNATLKFWNDRKDHENYFPDDNLVKAITQSSKYIYEVEREANSMKFSERVGIKTIKPRCLLIYGRSNDWNDEQKAAYRILNSSYHNLTILTYDHILDRAKRILGV